MNALPDDHLERLARAWLALAGLSVGDGFGAHANIRFARGAPARRELPPAPWRHTDDTAMACAVYEVLRDGGEADPRMLADAFVARYFRDRARGYSEATQDVLLALARGAPLADGAARPNGGRGSFGNGGAMRVAPLGAYFAEMESADYGRVVAEAARSAAVTHAHPEGVAGAIAVAVAAAWAARAGHGVPNLPPMLDEVWEWTPPGAVRDRLAAARDLPPGTTPEGAAAELGSGSAARQSVPFALWCAGRYSGTFVEAQWAALAGDGDRDTNCAMAGGVVALAHGRVPPAWLAAREPIDAAEW